MPLPLALTRGHNNVEDMHQTDTTGPTLPDPKTAPALFEGVLTRRVMAFFIDLFVMGLMILAFAFVGLIVGFVTFGLGWLALMFVVPATIVLYYGATLGSPKRATLGMQAMDIVLTPTRGQPLDGWMAFVHAGVFWVTTWISWPLSLLFALFTPRRQMIHDLITGTLMVRRSPMERHWRDHSARANQAY
ncbi:RDD family protein [Devosia sp. J2-20]|uniref:RDD family protein n=1 Tax=Devosia sp. J2-20 TaxID=3026161 RepID=UPI00249C298B|nr:RDD family protein [Devosia sp. J2-20]WDQ98039.1 RDD family protein [Devosia sp. J2-20]